MNIIKRYLFLVLVSVFCLPLFADNNSLSSVTLSRVRFENFSMPSAILVGEKLPCRFSIYNNNLTKIKSYTLNFYLGDETVFTYDGDNLAGGQSYNISVDIPIPEKIKKGQHVFTIGFAKVNGETLDPVYKSSTRRTVSIVAERLPRVGVMEELTARWCGYCPRGHVGMEKLQDKYKERFIGIAIHSYRDPMSYSNYPLFGMNSLPSCVLNRSTRPMDPYYGTVWSIAEDLEKVLQVPATVSVTLDATFNSDSSYIDATAQIKSLIDAEDYSVVFAVTGDDLYHKSAAWKQANYFASYSANNLPEDLQQFAVGGKYGMNPYECHYNNVLLASSYSNTIENLATLGKLTENGTTEAHFNLQMPTASSLKVGINYDLIYAIALVINGNGEIMNAAKVHVTSNPTGIKSSAATEKATTETARYTVDGQRVSQPVKGINIIRMADGRIVKQLIK